MSVKKKLKLRKQTDKNSHKYYQNKIAELEKELEDKSNFLASMSHEIRTPMNAIIALSELLLEEKNISHTQNKHLQTIANSSQLLLGIINDILDYSKIEAGKLHLENIPFDINMILDYIADIVSLKAQEKNLELIFDVERAVRAKFIGDPMRISQIILNLISNAIKFTSEGSITLKVSCKSINKIKNILQFEVIDTGIGISKKQLGTLFQKYSQADSSISREYGGSGLGLVISKELASLMGGTVWAESEQGKGSSFFVTLTLEIDSPQEYRVYRLPSKDIMSKKVLIIDSLEKSAKALQNMIAYFHIKTRSVQSFQEAQELLEKEQFDIVFVDDSICDYDLLLEYKNKYKLISVLIQSWINSANEKNLLENSIDYYMKKPFNQKMVFDTFVYLYTQNKITKNNQKKIYTKEDVQNLGKKTIVLAEDNTINQRIIKGLLSKTEIELIIANNGEEIVDLVQKTDPIDLILMDIKMPVMDGYQAAKVIRQNHDYDTIPIVAMTANAQQEDINKTKEYGMQEHLTKPIDVKSFYKLLVHILQS